MPNQLLEDAASPEVLAPLYAPRGAFQTTPRLCARGPSDLPLEGLSQRISPNQDLRVTEFVRRLPWHVLSRGFVKIRHLGFLLTATAEVKYPLPRTVGHKAKTQPQVPNSREASVAR
jgi:hypothetical protein